MIAVGPDFEEIDIVDPNGGYNAIAIVEDTFLGAFGEALVFAEIDDEGVYTEDDASSIFLPLSVQNGQIVVSPADGSVFILGASASSPLVYSTVPMMRFDLKPLSQHLHYQNR